MLETRSESFGRQNHLDYDVHGLVGIRLVDPSPTDAAAVARQLGPLESPLSRKPDIIVRFVKHLPTARLRYLGLKDENLKHAGDLLAAKYRPPVGVGTIRNRVESVPESVPIISESATNRITERIEK